ncbi:redoxin domain-containing protein [Ornithinibacillus halophilus]|uniref:Peroxiredoxin n=1 Tax=Ornithinibacillus halophilus TaxID=930117 RepID=A0A1M5CHA2_9BACI|nr:redoxin domain-containing protein [Ornithinibacillus halophilus]SHF54051.1 Peroxiredoxin [Ornithinibacillus halophilus]
MIKQVIGIAIIAVLGIILIVNITQQNSSNENENLVNSEDTLVSPEALGIKVGETAPDFELTTLEGENVKLSDFHGKKVFLNFWATWCPPCKKEMPEMQEFHEEYSDEVVIIALNATDSEKNEGVVADFIEEYDYTFPVLLDPEMKVVDEYMAISLPTTYFIGTDGVIQQQTKIGPMTYEFMESMMHELN